MSISTATAERFASPRRVRPRHVVGVVLAVIGLVAVVVAIATSSTTSTAGRVSSRAPVQSPALVQATGTPDSSVPGGTYRDPATHALLTVGTPAAPHAEPGPGHR